MDRRVEQANSYSLYIEYYQQSLGQELKETIHINNIIKNIQKYNHTVTVNMKTVNPVSLPALLDSWGRGSIFNHLP